MPDASGPPLRSLHKALSDPLRIRLLEALWVRPRSAKELAPLVEMRPERLYHHLAQLVDAGLAEISEYRPLRGGKVERVYAPTVLEPPEDEATAAELALFLFSMLEATRADIGAACEARSAGATREISLTRASVRLSLSALDALRSDLMSAIQAAQQRGGDGPYVRVLWSVVDLQDRTDPDDVTSSHDGTVSHCGPAVEEGADPQ